ncbi:MAG: NAD(P)/FAD-dependent oxidoreductase [Bryobacterales bacterium]
MADELRLDWPGLMRFKSSFTEPVPESSERSFGKKGIATFHGTARFLDRSRIQVGDDTLEARRFVIASGARPAALGFPGEELLTTSTDFLELHELPRRIVFVGGGYISFEFAHVAARAGASATILHRSDRPLRGFDPDLVNRLVKATKDLGIEVKLSSPVKAIEKRDLSFLVKGESEAGAFEIEADLVVHGAGRVPNVDRLDLFSAGVEANPRGVVVNEHLRSVSNPAVYAAGDAAATDGPPLTPVAGMEGHVVASNLLKSDNRTADYTAVASVVFTIPPLAAVGLLDVDARKKGFRFHVQSGDTAQWYSSRRISEEISGYKVLVEEGSGRILGAHLLGVHSEELINLFSLAIRFGIKASDLKQMAYAYPSRASDVPYMV